MLVYFAIIYYQFGDSIMKNDGKEFDGMHGLNTYDHGTRQQILYYRDGEIETYSLCGMRENVPTFESQNSIR